MLGLSWDIKTLPIPTQSRREKQQTAQGKERRAQVPMSRVGFLKNYLQNQSNTHSYKPLLNPSLRSRVAHTSR